MAHRFSMLWVWWKCFHRPVRKRRQKGLRVSSFLILLVVFKWYHGSEGVKTRARESHSFKVKCDKSAGVEWRADNRGVYRSDHPCLWRELHGGVMDTAVTSWHHSFLIACVIADSKLWLSREPSNDLTWGCFLLCFERGWMLIWVNETSGCCWNCAGLSANEKRLAAVSYTHLTLPTMAVV